MQNEEIEEIEQTLLRDIENHFTALNRNQLRKIVDALKEGQVWYERFNRVESHIKRQMEIGFLGHHTVQNILNLIQNVKNTHPLGNTQESQIGLYEAMIGKVALEYTKKALEKIFNKIEKILEKE